MISTTPYMGLQTFGQRYAGETLLKSQIRILECDCGLHINEKQVPPTGLATGRKRNFNGVNA